MRRVLLTIACLASLLASVLASGSIKGQAPFTLTFQLPSAATTSAGIFDSSNPPRLVRTLWGGVKYSAGVHQAAWDGLDDSGNPVGGVPPYTFKLLSHNAQVNWDGWIGNSGDYVTGTSHIKGLGGIVDLCCVADKIYALRGYDEKDSILTQSSIATPNQWTHPGGSCLSWNIEVAENGFSVASDGVYVYVGMAGNPVSQGPTQCSILGFRVADNTPLVWSSIRPIYGLGTGQNNSGQWLIVDGVTTNVTHSPNSMAVQRKGQMLAVALYNQNRVEFYDKRSGAMIANPLYVAGVTRVQFSPDDSSLWLSVGSSLGRYTFDGANWVPTSDFISFSDEIRSFAFDPVTGQMAVMCGGLDQRVHVFKGTTEVATIGAKDAYHYDPTVGDNKFMVSPNNGAQGPSGGGVTFQPDGKLWVISNRENRALRFVPNKSAKAETRIMWTSPYQLCLDPKNASRIVIAGGLEYKRDWSRPLKGGVGDSGWSYVKNWLYGMPDSRMMGLDVVVTAPNGRVYGIQSLTSLTSNIVELTSTGLRICNTGNGQNWLAADMALWSHLWVGRGASRVHTVLRAPLTGFDAAGNPQWGKPVAYCSMPAVIGVSPSYEGGEAPPGGAPFQLFPDGTFVSANTDAWVYSSPSCYYLGYSAPGSTAPYVSTARGELQLPLTRDGRVSWSAPSILSGTPTCWAVTSGQFAALGMNGEFWDNAQANQILLYHSSGLFVTQFGQRSGGNSPQTAAMGMAGNFLGVGMTTLPNNNLALIHSTESMLGASEWQISNLNSLQVTSSPIVNGQSYVAVSNVGQPSTDLSSIDAPVSFGDNFQRSDSGNPGNGWTGPVTPTWKLASGQLVSTASAVHMPSPMAPGALLLRPDSVNGSKQTILIPAQLWDTKRILSYNSAYQGWWGLASKYQSDGRCYACYAQFVNFTSNGVPKTNGTWNLQIGEYDSSGVFWNIAYDRAPALPPNPGHAYSVTFTTKWNPATNRTDLAAVLFDETTQTPLINLLSSSDEPALQGSGQVGIIGGCAQNVISSYSLAKL